MKGNLQAVSAHADRPAPSHVVTTGSAIVAIAILLAILDAAAILAARRIRGCARRPAGRSHRRGGATGCDVRHGGSGKWTLQQAIAPALSLVMTWSGMAASGDAPAAQSRQQTPVDRQSGPPAISPGAAVSIDTRLEFAASTAFRANHPGTEGEFRGDVAENSQRTVQLRRAGGGSTSTRRSPRRNPAPRTARPGRPWKRCLPIGTSA